VNSRLKEALRRKIHGHNRLVLLSTVGGGLGVLVMWIVIYFLGNWFPVFFLTILKGLDAEVPHNLSRLVFMGILVWIAVGWIERHFRTEGNRMDELSPLGVAIKLLTLPPRATFAVWDNLQNRVELDEFELEAASGFIERLFHAGKIQMQSVPIELPDDDARNRILTTLSATDLIRKVEINRTDFVALKHPERVAAFA